MNTITINHQPACVFISLKRFATIMVLWLCTRSERAFTAGSLYPTIIVLVLREQSHLEIKNKYLHGENTLLIRRRQEFQCNERFVLARDNYVTGGQLLSQLRVALLELVVDAAGTRDVSAPGRLHTVPPRWITPLAQIDALVLLANVVVWKSITWCDKIEAHVFLIGSFAMMARPQRKWVIFFHVSLISTITGPLLFHNCISSLVHGW